MDNVFLGIWRQGDFMVVNLDTKGIMILGRRSVSPFPMVYTGIANWDIDCLSRAVMACSTQAEFDSVPQRSIPC